MTTCPLIHLTTCQVIHNGIQHPTQSSSDTHLVCTKDEAEKEEEQQTTKEKDNKRKASSKTKQKKKVAKTNKDDTAKKSSKKKRSAGKKSAKNKKDIKEEKDSKKKKAKSAGKEEPSTKKSAQKKKDAKEEGSTNKKTAASKKGGNKEKTKKSAKRKNHDGKGGKAKKSAKGESQEDQKKKASKRSNSKGNKSKAGILEGGFRVGAKATISFKMKPTGNLVNYIRTRANVALLQPVKSSAPDQPAYLHAFYTALNDNATMQRELQTLGVYSVRDSPIQNNIRSFTVGKDDNLRTIDMQQLAVITGKGATKADIQKTLKTVVMHMNKHTNTSGPKQKYPTPTHLGDDLTPREGPVALDEFLLDNDVIQIIQMATPTPP